MVQAKKIFLISLLTMFFQHGFSAKTLLLRSLELPGKERLTVFEGYALKTFDLADQIESYLSGEIGELLSESRPDALIISAVHVDDKFTFNLSDGSPRYLGDDELVVALTGRGLLNPIGDEKRTIEIVFLNGCNTADLCKRLQNECGIPVVLGWNEIVYPGPALAMSFLFFRLLSLRLSYEKALEDGIETTKRLCRTDKVNVFFKHKTNEFYTEETFKRPGGYLEVSV